MRMVRFVKVYIRLQAQEKLCKGVNLFKRFKCKKKRFFSDSVSYIHRIQKLKKVLMATCQNISSV